MQGPHWYGSIAMHRYYDNIPGLYVPIYLMTAVLADKEKPVAAQNCRNLLGGMWTHAIFLRP